MASSAFTTFFLFLLLPLTQPLLTPPPGKPFTVILPTRKDAPTGLHLTTLQIGTPQLYIPLLIDLNGPILSTTICRQNNNSTTFISPFCRSAVCVSTGIRHSCGKKCSDDSNSNQDCRKSACVVISKNPITQKYAASELGQDTASFYFINQDKRGSGFDNIPNFIFACAPQSFRQGPFPDAAEGVAGLGHTNVALPTQISSRIGSHTEFTICLGSDSATAGGVGGRGGVFFGGVPFQLPKDTVYAPLAIGARGEYSTSLKSIRINNQALLSAGPWTAEISTTAPYTILPPALYTNFTQFFADQLTGVPRVEPLPPFGMCFDARILPVGSPNIEFFLTEQVRWVVLGVDALVIMRPNVACLAFVNGDGSSLGASPSAITIGLNHLEEKFVHFDLGGSRIGFVPSRLLQPFTCSGLNYFNASSSSRIKFIGD